MDYIYIRAWGKMTGSFGYYIERQVNRAIDDKAPENAVYYSSYEKRWITLDECNPNTQKRVNDWVEQIRADREG